MGLHCGQLVSLGYTLVGYLVGSPAVLSQNYGFTPTLDACQQGCLAYLAAHPNPNLWCEMSTPLDGGDKSMPGAAPDKRCFVIELPNGNGVCDSSTPPCSSFSGGPPNPCEIIDNSWYYQCASGGIALRAPTPSPPPPR